MKAFKEGMSAQEIARKMDAYFPAHSVNAVGSEGEIVSHYGMSLRDYFAGQALIALISKAPLIDRDGEFSEKQTQEYICKYHADMCESAYCYSDAMLKERAK